MTEAALLVAMAPRENANGTFVFFLNIFMVIFIFYFLLIRPQRKEQQRHQNMINAVKKGDEIVTNGGIIGTVIKADEKTLVIRTGGGDTKVTVERARVARTVTAEAES